jgi:hypothetical protein
VFRNCFLLLLATAACSSEDTTALRGGSSSRTDAGEADVPAPAAKTWKTVFSDLPGALFSVWGRSENDVWVVGSDANDGRGPLILHYDGVRWVRSAVASAGDFWWVHGFDGGPVYMGGSKGVIVRFESGRFTRVQTPPTAGSVFGIWGSEPGEVWAVGGDVAYGTGAFIWRLSTDRFEDVGPLPVPATDVIAYFKVWGTGKNDVWFVGSPGLSMHFDGTRFERVGPGIDDPLFTVHARPAGDLYAAVGGADLGVLIERRVGAPWSPANLPEGTRTLFGVWLTDDGGYAVGDDAAVLSRSSGAWVAEPTDLATRKGLHSVWVDSASGVWAAGGDILSPPYGAGILVHKGKDVAGGFVVEPFAPTDASRDRSETVREGGPDARPKPVEAGSTPSDAAPEGSGRDASRDAVSDGSLVRDARPETGPPRTVSCGAVTCSLPGEICCADTNTGVPAACVARSSSCPSGQAPVYCDEPADCPSGFGCCLNREAQVGPLQNVACEPGCFGPSVCQTTADCNGEACTVFSIMPSYKICPPPP